jgi:cytochrome c556
MKTRMWVLAGTLLLISTFGISAGDDPTPDIAEIMTKGHKPGGFKTMIADELKKGSPDWTALQEQTKEFVKLADALGKNEPPKGSADSWKKQTEAYAKIVHSLEAGAKKKSKSECNSAMGKLNQSCAGCHRLHKP